MIPRIVYPAAAALVLGSALLAAPASAQSMPNYGAWLNGMINQQMTLQRQGNQAARNLYYLCLSHPGACQPSPGGLQDSIQALQNQYASNFAASQRNSQVIYNTNRKFDIGVIQQRCWTQRQADGSYQSNC